MRLQLYYFKFTRNILLSKINTHFNPFLINQILCLRLTIEYYQQFCFYTCVFFSSFLLLITRQYPKLIKNSSFSLYIVSLRKLIMYDFLDRFVNLSLINSYRFLNLSLPKNRWNSNLVFNIVNFYFFPESLFLLNNNTVTNWFFYFRLIIYFSCLSNFKLKVLLLASFQIPVLTLITFSKR